MDLLVILGFFAFFLIGIGFKMGFDWEVKRNATILVNSKNSLAAKEKREVTRGEKGEMLADLKSVLDKEGEIKDKIPEFLAVLTKYPNASEQMLQQLRRFI